MKYYKQINIIKWGTTLMEIVGMALSAAVCIIGVILFLRAGISLSSITDWFQNHEFSELTGGYEAVGGFFLYFLSLSGVIAIFLIAGFAILLFLTFLIPSVHGILLLSGTSRYLATGEGSYRKAARRDSIIKMICNGIPAFLFILDLTGDISTPLAIMVTYYVIIYGLEIYTLYLLNGAKLKG